jgi:hypothetical protein
VSAELPTEVSYKLMQLHTKQLLNKHKRILHMLATAALDCLLVLHPALPQLVHPSTTTYPESCMHRYAHHLMPVLLCVSVFTLLLLLLLLQGLCVGQLCGAEEGQPRHAHPRTGVLGNRGKAHCTLRCVVLAAVTKAAAAAARGGASLQLG